MEDNASCGGVLGIAFKSRIRTKLGPVQVGVGAEEYVKRDTEVSRNMARVCEPVI